MEGPALDEAIAEAAVMLRSAGIEGAAREARLLAAHALESDGAGFLAGGRLSPVQSDRFLGLVRHRARRAPFAQVTGVREFWSLEFEVTSDTLTPRPDSETLIQCCLERFGTEGPARILDLGTGTGCLLVTLLAIWPRCRGLGVDVSARALEVAARNARRHAVSARASFIRGDWQAAVAGRFDLVVSNPPYVRTGEIAALEPEIALHEPTVALDGGDDGLDCFRRIVPGLAACLGADGVAVLEHGAGQGPRLERLAASCGLRVAETARDLSGQLRAAVLARR